LKLLMLLLLRLPFYLPPLLPPRPERLARHYMRQRCFALRPMCSA
jgi:hypothetical protein